MRPALPQTIPSFFWYFIGKQRSRLLILLLCMSCWSLQEAIYPYFIKVIIDKVSEFTGERHQIFSYLSLTLIYSALIVLFIEINYRVFDFLSARVYPKFMAEIRTEMFNYTIEHSHTYFAENFAGTIASRLSRMPEAAQRIIDLWLTIFFPILLTFILSCVVVSFTNPIFALIIAVWFIVHIAITMTFAIKGKKLAVIHSDRITKLHGKIVDTFSNIANVRLFSSYRFERKYIAKYQQDEYDTYVNSMHYNAIMKMCLGLVNTLFLCGMVIGSIYYYQRDMITIGDVALILSYHTLINAVWTIGMELIAFYELMGNCQEALTVINKPYDITDAENASELKVSSGKIEFQNVTFKYVRNNNVFKDKSLIIEPKQSVGLVGFSGSGKTTFVNLLLRYFDVTSGEILIDQQNIAKVTQDSLRRHISLIPQDSVLFHRPLIDNIRYGNVNASDEEVIEAAKQAHAHDFIMKLSDGYHTMVGERGIKLSGGQRQRIAIARAILKNAPILILDEATSSLDSITEKLIQDSLSKLMAQKTVIVIAHRLSTLLDMDRILVFEKGTVVEDGTHTELLAQNGHYAKLWNMQAGGFIPDNTGDEISHKAEEGSYDDDINV